MFQVRSRLRSSPLDSMAPQGDHHGVSDESTTTAEEAREGSTPPRPKEDKPPPLEQLPYDAILLVSFGGPEGRADVMPFLENVVHGKRVPKERLMAVAEHYYRLDGVSPINAQNRALIEALQAELEAKGPKLPIYWGNRNWHPLLPDALRQMKEDGIKRAVAIFTSAYSSYSGCRQYLENIEAARAEVGPGAPWVEKVRTYFNHPASWRPASTARARRSMSSLASGGMRRASFSPRTASRW